jgi:hypothetical protein
MRALLLALLFFTLLPVGATSALEACVYERTPQVAYTENLRSSGDKCDCGDYEKTFWRRGEFLVQFKGLFPADYYICKSKTTPAASTAAPEKQVCDLYALWENFKWFHRDALVNRHSAYVRGIITRQVNGLIRINISAIRAAYKEGQKHNANASNVIESCDEEQVLNAAYNTVEEIRLKTCGASQPAQSATCPDITENLRWAMLDSDICAIYSRAYIDRGVTGTDLLTPARARRIRIGLKIAQGHREEVFDSVDYIGDVLLIRIATSVYEKYGVADLQSRYPANDDLAKRQCPGWAKVLSPT